MRSHLRTSTIWKYRVHKWRRVCFFLVPKREPRYTTLLTRGENHLSMLLLYTWWHGKKQQKVPALCLRHLWTFRWALWFLVYGLFSSIKCKLRDLKFFPTHPSRSLFTFARPDLQSVGEKRKEFGLHTWFLIERWLPPEVQYHQASSSKTSLLARSTESKFCHLQIYGRFSQLWSLTCSMPVISFM